MSDEKVRQLHKMINASVFGWPSPAQVKKAHELLDEIIREVTPRQPAEFWAGISAKPPLGLMPKKLWEEKRGVALCEAMQRYVDAGRSVPSQWVDELLKRVKWLMNDSR